MAKLTLQQVQLRIDAGEISSARALFNHAVAQGFRANTLRRDLQTYFMSKGWPQAVAEAEAERLAP